MTTKNTNKGATKNSAKLDKGIGKLVKNVIEESTNICNDPLPEPPAAVKVTELEAITVTRDEIVALAKEINKLLDVKINVTKNATNEMIIAELEKQIVILEPADFGSEPECITATAQATFYALGFELPNAEALDKTLDEKATETKPAPKTAEELTKEKAEKKANKAAKVKAPKVKTFTRSDAAIISIKDVCRTGATLKQIVDRTDAIMVEHGFASVPDAINVNKYALLGLVGFGVLSFVDGKYTIVEPATV